MEYSFSIDDAIEHGLEEAVMIKNFKYWILKNQSSDKHNYDGKTWTYNSAKSFTKLFPFWTKKQIERILKSLINQNVLVVGNYNKMKYDQTRWFAFNDEKRYLEITKQEFPNYQMVTPIPNINTYNKQYIGQNVVAEEITTTDGCNLSLTTFKNQPETTVLDNNSFNTGCNNSSDIGCNKLVDKELEEQFNLWWLNYPRKVGKTPALKSFKKALTKTDFNTLLTGLEKYIGYIKENKTETRFIKHPTSWLNQESWLDVYNTGCSGSDDFLDEIERRIKNG